MWATMFDEKGRDRRKRKAKLSRTETALKIDLAVRTRV